MNLNFDLASCVRASSKFSTCTRCVEICPVDTIKIIDNIPGFTPSICVDCGGCVGICPTEAFSLKEFSAVEFLFSLLKTHEKLISCKTNVPCISVLNAEYLISLALASDDPVVLDLGHCHNCAIKEPLLKQIEENIEEANFVLSSFGAKQLVVSMAGYRPLIEDIVPTEHTSRRAFLSNLSIKGAVKHNEAFKEAVDADEQLFFEIENSVIAKIKDKKIPNKRKILFSTLKRAPKPAQYETIPCDEISFVSQKFINSSCTNCQICYRICPTGALSSDSRSSVIHFDTMLCLKCRLCHDVCDPNAIELQSGFEIKEFFEPKQKSLAIFDIKRCHECGNYFTYNGGEQICPRCVLEEEEAMLLHTNAKKMGF